MGYCMKPKGRASVEIRRESFTVHYGAGHGDQEPEDDKGFSSALEKFWREVPHPEFLTEDLDDVIKALQAARQYIKTGRERSPSRCSRESGATSLAPGRSRTDPIRWTTPDDGLCGRHTTSRRGR